MPNNAECLEALPHFRNKLLRRHADPGAFVAAGMTSRDYATGITLRKRRGKSLEGEFALRLFVFEKSEVGVVAQEIQDFEGLPVEVAHLHRPVANATGRRHQGEHVLPRLPIVGGVSIGPRDTSITGTLGCFVSRTESRESGFFALSNNHVLANGDLLKIGTSIVHPAQGHVRTPTEYAFASLSETIQMKFITDTRSSERNLYDAALAVVTARFEDILTGTIRGIDRYDPTHSSEATEKMEVIKCGQTTGVTEGTVDSTHILTEVDYSPKAAPRMATFDEVFVVRGKDGSTFAAEGDSGSIILEKKTGHPVGLLFAADKKGWALACDFGKLCESLNVQPV